jgi:hypothetical protein
MEIRMTPNDIPDLSEYELREMLQQVFAELVEEGELEIVGREADGEPVFGSTKPQSFPQRLMTQFSSVLVLPALIAEYILGSTAVALAKISGPGRVAYTLADFAGLLRAWRHSETMNVWPTIRY